MSLQSYLYVVTVGQLNYKPNTLLCFEVVPRDESATVPPGKIIAASAPTPFSDRPSSTILGRRAYQRPNVDIVLGVHWPRSSQRTQEPFPCTERSTSAGSTRLLLGSSQVCFTNPRACSVLAWNTPLDPSPKSHPILFGMSGVY